MLTKSLFIGNFYHYYIKKNPIKQQNIQKYAKRQIPEKNKFSIIVHDEKFCLSTTGRDSTSVGLLMSHQMMIIPC